MCSSPGRPWCVPAGGDRDVFQPGEAVVCSSQGRPRCVPAGGGRGVFQPEEAGGGQDKIVNKKCKILIVECESLRSNVKTVCVVYFLSAKEIFVICVGLEIQGGKKFRFFGFRPKILPDFFA